MKFLTTFLLFSSLAPIAFAQLTPADLNRSSINGLARALVADLAGDEEKSKEQAFPDKRVYMARHTELTEEKLGIIRDFGVPNLFQTGNSTQRIEGTLEGKQVKINSMVLGLDEPQLEPTLLQAKYAVVDSSGNMEMPIPVGYGSVMIEFRLEEIQSRTTYTMSDSYGTGQSAPRGSPLVEDSHLKYKEELQNATDYVEAQIWGELSPRDIKTIYLTKSQIVEFESTLKELADTHGIDIFEMTPAFQTIAATKFFTPSKLKLKFAGRKNLEPAPQKTSEELIKMYRDTDSDVLKNVILDRLGLMTTEPSVRTFIEAEIEKEFKKSFHILIERIQDSMHYSEQQDKALQRFFSEFDFQSEEDQATALKLVEGILTKKAIENEIQMLSIEEIEKLSKERGASQETQDEIDMRLEEIKRAVLAKHKLNSLPLSHRELDALSKIAGVSSFQILRFYPELTPQDGDYTAGKRLGSVRVKIKWAQQALKRRPQTRDFLEKLTGMKDNKPNSSVIADKILRHEPFDQPKTNSSVVSCGSFL